MLDLRAWIIAGVILAAAVGSYMIWIRRPQVTQTGRSLSASGRHSSSSDKPKTISLHVDGCVDDFIVKPGELVEPRAIPGAPIDEFRRIYGQGAKAKDRSVLWDENAFTLTDLDNGQGVRVSLKQGHVLETLDGIELGIDSFGTLYRKMARDRKVQLHERIAHTGHDWTLVISFYSSCGKQFRSEYSRTLPGSPEIEKLIYPRSQSPGTSTSRSTDGSLWRSDVFMNKIVSDYALVPSTGRDESTLGDPSEHD